MQADYVNMVTMDAKPLPGIETVVFENLSITDGRPTATTPKPTKSTLTTNCHEIPVMDRVLTKFRINLDGSANLINSRYCGYAQDSANGLSPMERDLLKLQVNDPYQWNGKDIKDYQSTRDIYQKNYRPETLIDPQPRFQLCHYISPRIADLEDFLYKMRSAPKSKATLAEYENKFHTLFKALATGNHGSLKLEPDKAREYTELFNKLITKLKESIEEPDAARGTEEFTIAKLGIENYFYYHFLPKELLRYGLIMGPDYAVNSKRLRYFGIAMPKLTETIIPQLPVYKRIREHNIPILLFDSANATLDHRLPQTTFGGGIINVNLLNVEAEVSNEIQAAKTWKQRFDSVYEERPDFRFEQDPRFLDQMLLLGFHGASSSADAARNRILDANIEEQLAVSISRIYIENLYRQSLPLSEKEELKDDLSFWAGIAQGGRMFIDKLFKNKTTTTINDAYNTIEAGLGIGDTGVESFDARNVKRGLAQILNVESRLRALAQSNNPLYLLVKSLQHVIIPMRQENGVINNPRKAGLYGAEVILTKLLTEKLLGKESEQLCKDVKWDELLKLDFTNFECYSYQNFLQDSTNPANDPLGLMKLRRAWYKFFDEQIGGVNYEKNLQTWARSSEIQKAVGSLVKREFTSYHDREMPEHLAYYQRHRSYGIPDRINDMST